MLGALSPTRPLLTAPGTFGLRRLFLSLSFFFDAFLQHGHEIDDFRRRLRLSLLLNSGDDLGLSRFDSFFNQVHEIFVIRIPIFLRVP